MYKVCLVEDESDLNKLIVKYLNHEGYQVYSYYSGEDALESLDKGIDLYVLDIMLQGSLTGYDLIEKIKSNSDAGIIFTSARDKDIDRIKGLALGSDDYLAKPYSPKELMLRCKAILRRIKKDNNELRYNDYIIDKDNMLVKKGKEVINITTMEFELLLFFINNRNKPFSRKEILKEIWGENYDGNERAVDDLTRRLRQKMPSLNVETLYGFGYRLV